MMAQSQTLLELFAGIGGMRVAAEEIGLKIGAIHPFEINPSALDAYCHHFSETGPLASHDGQNFHGCDPMACKKIKLAPKGKGKSEKKTKARNLLGLTMDEWNKLGPDWLTMSPPCQPFTRQGLRLDTADPRTDSLQHVLALLKDGAKPPPRILLENVKGFETSCARREVLQVLHDRGYAVKEFLLCPSQLGVPNSRLRYYLLAALTPSAVAAGETGDSSTSQEVSLTFPLCLCLPWVQTEETSSDGSAKSCCRCGKYIVPKASTLLEKFHSNALKQYNGMSGIESPSEVTQLATLKFSDITPTLSQYLHSVRVNSAARCSYCTDSGIKQSCHSDHQINVPNDSIKNGAGIGLPENVESAAVIGGGSSSVLAPDASPILVDKSSKSLDGHPTASEDATPVSTLSCDGYCRYRLKEKLLTKYGRLLDVVDDSSRRTCCFTKGYGRLVEGTGSVFNPSGKRALDEVFSRVSELDKGLEQQKDEPSNLPGPISSVAGKSGGCDAAEQHTLSQVPSSRAASNRDTENDRSNTTGLASQHVLESKPNKTQHPGSRYPDSRSLSPTLELGEHTSPCHPAAGSCPVEQASVERSRLLLPLGLRYFSPREALRLMGFPERFTFPDHLSCRQQQQLIGNSVNVLVVAVLMAVLEQTTATAR